MAEIAYGLTSSGVYAQQNGAYVDVSQLVSGNLDHIETITASSQATVDFTNVFASDDGYDRYVVVVSNFIPATDNADLIARFSSDGGANWDSGASDYAWSAFEVQFNGATSALSSSGDAKIGTLINNPGNNPSNNENGGASFVLSNPTDAARSTVLQNGSVRNFFDGTNENFSTVMGGGIRLSQSAVDSIRLLAESGNISSGIFSVYGASTP